MNPDNPTPDSPASVDAMAAAWLVEEEEGFSPEQAEAFVRWQEADPRHAAAVARLQDTMAVLQRIPELRETGRMPVPFEDRPPRVAKRRIRWSILAPLAAAAALVGGVLLWPSRPAVLPAEMTYATTSNGYQRVTLEDGSVVELNASSEVRVQFSRERREVALVRGEALFSVAKNPHRPFIVTARHISVRAVGTAFDVRYQGTNVEVLVTEGKVEIGSPDAAHPGAFAGTGEPQRVAAGERVVIAAPGDNATSPVVEKAESAATSESLAWQAPHFVFVDTPLGDIAAQFNRRNRIQLEIRDPTLASRLVGGNFRADNVEAFVRLLEGNHDIAAERPDAEHIILRSAK